MSGRRGKRGVQLAEVVAAAAQRVDLRRRHVRDQRAQLGVEAEEPLLVVDAVVGAERLVLAVDGVRERAQQRVAAVAREQRIPVGAPQHLDDVPPRAGEQRLELLDDLAVAAHGPVEPLQVAVDDEGQVVELLARGERQRADRLRLVHLAVAEYAPDAALRGLCEVTVIEVAQETCLVDRADGTDAHRTGRELPELRHQPRMRVRAQPAPGLLAEVRELLLVDPTLQEGSRIDARRRVRLEENEVAGVIAVRSAEEVVEAGLEDLGRRGVGGDVAAELAVGLVRPHHHRQRVPAHDRRDALLELDVTRVHGLLLERDRVLVGRVRRHVGDDAELLGLLLEAAQQEQAAVAPGGLDSRAQRFEPFGGLGGVHVDGIGRVHVGLLWATSHSSVSVAAVAADTCRMSGLGKHDMLLLQFSGA